MQLINAYFGTTLIDLIEQALASNKGDRFDVCVGYAKNLTDARFKRFGTALESWLTGDSQRRFRLFVGDHRHFRDTPKEQADKLKECTEVAANLIKFARSVEEQMEVVFLHKLHAKLYSMWSHDASGDRLIWAIIGSSNLTDAALKETNIELDIYLEPGDPHLQTIEKTLTAVLRRSYSDGESWGDLHDVLNKRTAKTRWENDKLRYLEDCEAEMKADEKSEALRQAEETARRDSDQQLGLTGAD